jgi:tetratricopeptide (TPR) repeat protein
MMDLVAEQTVALGDLSATADDLNRQGVEFKRQGRLDEAAACYESALRLRPHFAEAQYNLGILWRDAGQIERALDGFQKAVALRPDVALVHFELANLLTALGRREAAVGHFQDAVRLAPGWAPARFNLGSAYLELQRWRDAEDSFRAALRLTPDDADAWVNLGLALKEQRKLDEAVAALRRAVTCRADHPAAWTNLGTLLKDSGRYDAAAECYQRALAADPQLAAACSNLGNTCLELGQHEAGLAAFQRAAALRPDDPRSFVDLANGLHRLGRTSQAIEALQQAIRLDSHHYDAWLNLGNLLRGIGDFDQANAMYHELARQRPHDPLEQLRAAANCPLVFQGRDELDQYRAQFLDTASKLARAELSLDFSRITTLAPVCPYNLQFLDGNLCPLKRAFADVFASYFARHNGGPPPRGSGAARPRVGFVVTGSHEAAFLKLMAGVVERLDARQFDLVVLCSRLGEQKIRAGLPHDQVRVCGFPDRFDQIADALRQAHCDLLYYWEVGTDPANYFLPFLRLAPVQVTGWGIQVTSGIPELDAYLSSSLVESPGADDHYTEQLCRGSTLLTYQLPVHLPAQAKNRSDFGLGPHSHLYGCVQNLGKFHPDFDDLLAEVLRRDGNGLLVVCHDHHGFSARALRRRWNQCMPDVARRVVFLPPQTQTDYLCLLAQCDVLLDPMQFGGVTTSYDALALAKPVVTLPTEFHRGRYTAACLRKIGVTDTIAADRDDYVNLAVSLAADEDRRADLSRRMRDARPLAFWDAEAVREHERIFHELLVPVR